LLRDNLRHAGVLEHCIAGIVLSGGASRLPGILDVAESVLRRAARLAWPTPMAKMPSFLAEPEFATVLAWRITGTRAAGAWFAGAEFWFSHESAVCGKGRVRDCGEGQKSLPQRAQGNTGKHRGIKVQGHGGTTH